MEQEWTVAALYCFAPLPHYRALQAKLLEVGRKNGIKGSLLLAQEGINGTVAGSKSGIKALVAFITAQKGLEKPELKYSAAREQPFRRLKVRLKKEIVTMGVEGVDPLAAVGAYVAPADWNALIQDKDTILIDTRNDYEYAIGSFAGAVDPNIKTFREFPQWLQNHAAELRGKKNIAMFCTGGIRCEKSTAYAKKLGYDNVYHLKGGILKYLEEIPEEKSLWKGECFVFDERVSLGHGLKEGGLHLCRACRRPLTAQDMQSPHYAEGVSCPACYKEHNDADRARFAERQKQAELAQKRRAKAA